MRRCDQLGLGLARGQEISDPYLQSFAARLFEILPEIAARAEGAAFLNPGVSDVAVTERAAELGIDIQAACSIVDIGLSPADSP